MANHRYWRLKPTVLGPRDDYPESTALDMRFDGNPPAQDQYAGSVVLNVRGNQAIYDDTGKTVTLSGGIVTSNSHPHFSRAAIAFDGSNDYFAVAHDSALTLVGVDFTIEMWVYVPTGSGGGVLIVKDGVVGASYAQYLMQVETDRKLSGFLGNGNGTSPTGTSYTSANAIPADTWTHVAMVKNGSTCKGFIAGVQEWSGSVPSMFDGAKAVRVGHQDNDSGYFAGYIRDIRITKGVPRYNSGFTPPASTLPAVVTQTPICDLQAHKITLSLTSGLTTSSYSGPGALLVANADDVITVDNAADICDFGTGDFTIEARVYFDSVSPTDQSFLHCGTVWNSALGYLLKAQGDEIAFYAGNGSGISLVSATGPLSSATWHHIAVSRTSGVTKLYVDGVEVASYTGSVSISSTSELFIGSWRDATEDFSGRIDQLRITKGVGRYPSAFTPPDRRVSLAYVEFRGSSGGSNLVSGGTASVSTSSVGNAGKVFDSDLTSSGIWVSTGSDAGPYAAYDFGSGNDKDIRAVYIQNTSDASYLQWQATVMKLQYSDDGSAYSDLMTIDHEVTALSGGLEYVYPEIQATAALEAPAPVMVFRTGGAAFLTAPTQELRFFTGAVAQLVAPVAQLLAAGGARLALTAPSPDLKFTSHDSTGENAANLVAPSPILVAYGGANARLTAPIGTLSATATIEALARAALSAPSPGLDFVATVGLMARASMVAPSASLRAFGGAIAAMTAPLANVSARASMGTLARASLIAPSAVLSFTASREASASAALAAPSPMLAFFGGASILLSAPSPQLRAVASLLVTVDYEAYAVNLKHDLPDSVFEVTRYTNYPFTQFVRYQGQYFGVAADGLYLLGGDTDGEEPIAYVLDTHATDFATGQKKHVPYLYFKGRVGPSAEVNCTVGESLEQTYRYKDPRGAGAMRHRQKLGNGLNDHYWAFGIADPNGGEMALDTLDPQPIESTRGN